MSKRKTNLKPERTYKTTIRYNCPKRGEVAQEVEVKVFRGGDTNYPMYGTEEVEELLRQEEASVFDDDLF